MFKFGKILLSGQKGGDLDEEGNEIGGTSNFNMILHDFIGILIDAKDEEELENIIKEFDSTLDASYKKVLPNIKQTQLKDYKDFFICNFSAMMAGSDNKILKMVFKMFEGLVNKGNEVLLSW